MFITLNDISLLQEVTRSVYRLWMDSSSSIIMTRQPLPVFYRTFSFLDPCATSLGQIALSLLTPPTPFKHSGRACYDYVLCGVF